MIDRGEESLKFERNHFDKSKRLSSLWLSLVFLNGIGPVFGFSIVVLDFGFTIDFSLIHFHLAIYKINPCGCSAFYFLKIGNELIIEVDDAKEL
jgi:hypothetical protein